MNDFLRQSTYYVYDRLPDSLQSDSLAPFALGDALLRQVNQDGSPSILHFWPMDEMVILGMMDTKLPYLPAGITYVEESGYDVRIRPAGGLAVVADSGILNFSLILKEPEEEKLSIDDGYEIMVNLIRQTFAPYGKNIEAYEIPDSYCPGKFDLSIDGKKFAGIAQRRFKKGIGIMIYLSVEGNQPKRGELIKNFYRNGLQGAETKWHYPDVNPDSMANLSDLLDVPLTVSEVQEMIVAALAAGENQIMEPDWTDAFHLEYQEAHDKMEKRNQQILEQRTRR